LNNYDVTGLTQLGSVYEFYIKVSNTVGSVQSLPF